jgi:predicted RND superfamily exporter protein
VAEGREELVVDLKYLDDLGYTAHEITDDGPYYVITDVGTLNPFTREEQFSALTDSMAMSVLISIVLCLVVMVLLFRSLKLGVAAIVPMVLVVAWLYGVMEMTGNYLNSVTVTIAAISIGVGVDYAIHVTHRFREEFEKHGEYEEAMAWTMASTGNALAFSAGSTFVGFLIIGLSPMTMFSKFGYLTALMIGMAFVAAVVVLPSFLALTVPKGGGGEEIAAPDDAEPAGG